MKASHVKTLQEAIKVWSEEDPDVKIISKEPRSLPAHRLILSMFSSKLKNLFKSSSLYHRSTLFLPECSYDSISNVLSSIYSGVIPDLKDSEQQEFEETFHLLGFDNRPNDQSKRKVVTHDATKSDKAGIKRAKPNPSMRQKMSVGEVENSEDDESSPGKSDPLPNGCICRSFNPFLPTITCKNKYCKIKKFHLVCVNLKTVPKGGWTCDRCKKSTVSKCEVCPYESPGGIKPLLLHYANQHFRSSLVELIDVFFKGNQCFHCEKEVYHNGESQKIIHIAIAHGKMKTILKSYGINLHMKMPKSRDQPAQFKRFDVTEMLSDGTEPTQFICELCKIRYSSNNDLLSHLGTYHFKSEITNLLKYYFLYQDNYCRRCPDQTRAIPGLSAKIIHVGTVHGVSEKLLEEMLVAEREHLEGKSIEKEGEKNVIETLKHQLDKTTQKDSLIILNEVVIKEELDVEQAMELGIK